MAPAFIYGIYIGAVMGIIIADVVGELSDVETRGYIKLFLGILLVPLGGLFGLTLVGIAIQKISLESKCHTPKAKRPNTFVPKSSI